ncbi:MAG: putative alcohol dehydrogenase AdhA [Deltaproteobacteria bacterium]|jgi:propanol-preferring alcohol dehydrogenase|nr:putative alcohol dehydrogenase AdhA [Deltaproteobacteria bacterium]
MKAMMLHRPSLVEEKPLKSAILDLRKPEESEVLIRVSCCAVCRTDLHIVEGELVTQELPIIPGHQVVGMIEETGKGVDELKTGDRVGVPWMNSTCCRCDYCCGGRENLCDSAQFNGLNFNGGYAEYVTVPAQFVYKLPETIADRQAAPLLCAGIIGYRSLKLCGIKSGEKLGIYGFGASAHITIQVAVHLNCEVYVFTRSEEHQLHAEELGAVWSGGLYDDPGVELDSALIFAPAGNLMVESLNYLRKGGTVVSAGIHMSDIPKFPYRFLYGERAMMSATNATYQDGMELLKLAGEIPIRTEVNLYRLEQANQALLDLKQSRINGAAVLTIG